MFEPIVLLAAALFAALWAAGQRRDRPPRPVPGLGLLGLVGVLHNPGHIVPGMDGVVESQRKTQQVAGATTTHDFVFVFEGAYAGVTDLLVLPVVWIQAKSGGSASASVTWAFQVVPTADGCTVRATLNAAPGGVETTTIGCSILVAGKAAR